MTARKLTAVDLFAGAGGLSLGLRQAGFRLVGAVEVAAHAVETYRANLRGVRVLQQDVRQVDADALRCEPGTLDLLAGCAPCQGFSSLTSKHSRRDPRNQLVLEMARLVEELKPASVMMENVPGLAGRGEPLLEEFVERLRVLGYLCQWHIVQMADFGVPQYRRRLVLLAGRGFVIRTPEPTHASKFEKKRAGRSPHVTVREAIGARRAPVTMSYARRRGGPQAYNWHVVRDLQPQTKERLRSASPGGTWLDYDEKLRPRCHRGGYSGFRNTYGRLEWDAIAPTITSGCTTPAKGRFGHPDRRRVGTISVREAATLQTFPDSFRFTSDYIERVTEMIGNAVPPRFAESAGSTIAGAIRDHRAALGN